MVQSMMAHLATELHICEDTSGSDFSAILLCAPVNTHKFILGVSALLDVSFDKEEISI